MTPTHDTCPTCVGKRDDPTDCRYACPTCHGTGKQAATPTDDTDAALDLDALACRVFCDYHTVPRVIYGRVAKGYAARADIRAWRIVLAKETDGRMHDGHPERTFMHEAAHLLTGCTGHSGAFFSVLNALCLAYLDEESADALSHDAWDEACESAGEWGE